MIWAESCHFWLSSLPGLLRPTLISGRSIHLNVSRSNLQAPFPLCLPPATKIQSFPAQTPESWTSTPAKKEKKKRIKRKLYHGSPLGDWKSSWSLSPWDSVTADLRQGRRPSIVNFFFQIVKALKILRGASYVQVLEKSFRRFAVVSLICEENTLPVINSHLWIPETVQG